MRNPSCSSVGKDPSASIYTAQLLKEAGVPDGVFNGARRQGAVDAVSSIGHQAGRSRSTPIARYVYETGRSRKRAKLAARRTTGVLPTPNRMAADAP